jgi:hypothetical protein
MPRIQAHEVNSFTTNVALQHAVEQYKTYCTIRRDLRTVDSICTYVIGLHESLISERLKLDDVSNHLFIIRAASMHAIILYSRWFQATKGKTMLNAKDYFTASSKQMSVHDKIMEHRNRYLAHNDLDLLGSDRVWVITDKYGRFVSSESDWIEQMWIQDNEFNMSTFQKCVHIVHNKIDSKLIPNRQNKLDILLKSILG